MARKPAAQDETTFNRIIGEQFDKNKPDYEASLNIAVIGKVSSGKSSLINAILGCDKDKPVAKVNAKSGTTKAIQAFQLADNVLLIDSPGLDDVRTENSEITKKFLASIDLGIFVVSDSVDRNQKELFEDLKKNSKNILVVLNKIDIFDKQKKSLDEVVAQWKKILGVEEIYCTCTLGYDPNYDEKSPLDLRGIDELVDAVYEFLEKDQKGIHFGKILKKKHRVVTKIILKYLAIVAGESLLPGSAAFITATQCVAIANIHYVMTGTILSKSNAIALLPTFVARSVGMNLFLWAESMAPPTGVLEVAAAGIAMLITYAMLMAVYTVLKNGYSLEDVDKLKQEFDLYKSRGKPLVEFVKGLKLRDLGDVKGVMEKLRGVLGGMGE